jgi:hypothetical protein
VIAYDLDADDDKAGLGKFGFCPLSYVAISPKTL